MRSMCFVGALLVSSVAHASVLQFDLNKEYTFGSPPAGAPAWLRVEVNDHNANGSVTLKIQSLTLTASEFVSKVMLNIKPTIALGGLTASAPIKTGSFADPVVQFGSNAFNAGGGSSFDMLVTFENAPPENRFGAGDMVTMDLTGHALLNSGSFNALSSGGSGGMFVSAHVQGIGTNGNFSGWITTLAPTPEPASAIALAAIGTIIGRRRRC